MKPLLIAYLLNIIDYLFTAYWVSLYGITMEANPFGRWLFENNVVWVFKIFIMGILFAVLGVCIYIKPRLACISHIPLVAYAIIVVYHIVIFFLIK